MTNPTIGPDGVVAPGVYTLTHPIVLEETASLHGKGLVTLIAPLTFDAVQAKGSSIVVSGVRIQGGLSSISVRAGTEGVEISDCTLIGATFPSIFALGDVTSCLIERVLILGGGDNGIQIRGGVKVRLCGLIGPFGNKAIDCTHGVPRDVQIVHCTILDPHGYGIGLRGWGPGRGLVCANNLVLCKPTGPGSSGYCIDAANGGDVVGNVVNGPVWSPLSAHTPPQAHVDGPGVLVTGDYVAATWNELRPNTLRRPELAHGSIAWRLRRDALGQSCGDRSAPVIAGALFV